MLWKWINTTKNCPKTGVLLIDCRHCLRNVIKGLGIFFCYVICYVLMLYGYSFEIVWGCIFCNSPKCIFPPKHWCLCRQCKVMLQCSVQVRSFRRVVKRLAASIEIWMTWRHLTEVDVSSLARLVWGSIFLECRLGSKGNKIGIKADHQIWWSYWEALSRFTPRKWLPAQPYLRQ